MKTRYWMLVFVTLLLWPAPSFAQAPDALVGDKPRWDQPAASLADAQGFVYELSMNGGAATATPSTCTGAASPFRCVGTYPALTPGTHTFTVTTILVLSDGRRLASQPSAAFTFTLRVVPSAATNVGNQPSESQ